jgi:hypothetical protein
VLGWLREAQDSDFIASHGDKSLHGVLHSGAERRGFARALDLMAARGATLWFFGHTHNARVWRIDDSGAVLVDGDVAEVDPRFRYVVNVGTTGLPLPGRGRPSFTLYDDTAGSLASVPVTIHRPGASLLRYSQ